MCLSIIFSLCLSLHEVFCSIVITSVFRDQFEVGESSSAVAVWVDETSEANEPFVTEETNDQTVSEADVIELLSVDEVTELVGRRDEENREQEEREEGDDEESQSQSSTQEASSSSGNDGQTRAQSSGYQMSLLSL